MIHRETFSVTMESVDAVGIVYFGSYWNWYETTFERFVSAASGSSWREVLAAGLAMPVVHAEIDYLKPLRLSDEVKVELRLVRLGARSIHFEARFDDGSGEPVALAKTVNVLTAGDDFASVEMPGWLLAAAETSGGQATEKGRASQIGDQRNGPAMKTDHHLAKQEGPDD